MKINQTEKVINKVYYVEKSSQKVDMGKAQENRSVWSILIIIIS